MTTARDRPKVRGGIDTPRHDFPVRTEALTAQDRQLLVLTVENGIERLPPEQLAHFQNILETEIPAARGFSTTESAIAKYLKERDRLYKEKLKDIVDGERFQKSHIWLYGHPPKYEISRDGLLAGARALRAYVHEGIEKYGLPFLPAFWRSLIHRAKYSFVERQKLIPSLTNLIEHRASRKTVERLYSEIVRGQNYQAAQLKTGLPLPDSDVVVDDETKPMEGPLPKRRNTPDTRGAKAETTKRLDQPKPSPRDRKGYIQPDRQGKVGVAGFLDPDIHTQYYALAIDTGLSVPALTTYLANEAVKKQNDPAFRAALAQEAERLAEIKRQAAEAKKTAVARRNSTMRGSRRTAARRAPT